MRRTTVLTAVLWVIACTPEADNSPAEGQDRTDTSLSGAPTEAMLDVEFAPVPDDSTCQFVATAGHPDPDSLIAEFLARDARGEFLRTSPWFAGATTCPGHEPGPDSYAVIENFEAVPLTRSARRVGVVVTGSRIGYVSGGRFVADPGTEVDTVFAVETSHGWRIESPALRLQVMESVARNRGDLVNLPVDSNGTQPNRR